VSFVTLPALREVKPERATALVFEDVHSRALLERIERIAPSDACVLITGETGTGKELVARHVHAMSRRRDRPFVAVNCGALTDSLVESELFGHERGAFTGAHATLPGWFEQADGGTLFLDEIGELPLPAQVKLLRVLQEREVVRLGSRTPIPVDVRIIAATNVELAEAVAAGRFREDLFYRIHVAALRLLPLRERPGDILPLARFFAQRYARQLGLGTATLSPDAERKLLAHPWPGNIRELENTIHHALLLCRHQRIEADDIQPAPLRPTPTTPIAPAAPPATAPASPPPSAMQQLEEALTALFEEAPDNLYTRVEDALILGALRLCNDNQSQAARLLGITRNVLRGRLARLAEPVAAAREP